MGHVGRFEQTVDLRPHGAGTSDVTAQDGLVHHHPQLRRLRLGEQCLPFHPQRHMALDVRGPCLADRTGAQDGARVVLGLEQAGDEVRLVGAQEARGAFQADVHAEPVGQHVVEALPPAGLVGLLGEFDEGVGLLVGDSVGLEEELDVRDLQPDLGRLHPAYGPGGDTEHLRRLVTAQADALPQILQALAENDLTHGRGGPRFAHFRPPDALCPSSVPRARLQGHSHSGFFRVPLAKCSRQGESW